MAKIKRKGESGAAKNYVTRSAAIRKLQISLADFRRLCILKGIYPRDPLHKKKANKGSTAPTSFYYTKDIQYLLHEPLLDKFREHKAFAKKLARAVGRQEWGLAKNLEDAKPVLRLDHLVKERYPTFTLALQDLQDPLNLVHLFSRLPTNPIPGKTTVPTDAIADCARLISEWKLWAIRTHSLQKVFLGIKGVYYECVVPSNGQDVRVRWLEGYEFQQHVPTDVDFRILLTFVELYRVLLGFTLFKLYNEENLVYPPPLDKALEEKGESVGAYKLVQQSAGIKAGEGSGVSKKAVKRAIHGMATAGVSGEAEEDVDMDEDAAVGEPATEEPTEDFIERPSKDVTDDVAPGSLTTYNTIISSSSATASSSNLLFSQYTFYLSREISARTWEFVLRSLGARVISATQMPDPSGSDADANAITHVVIDRPMTEERKRAMENGRKWVWIQPQWVADCVNRGKVLAHDEYAPGKLLPPHLSPWEGDGEMQRPWLDQTTLADGPAAGERPEVEEEEEEEDEEADVDVEEEDSDDDEESTSTPTFPPALLASAQNPADKTLLHAAELEAESAGTSSSAFQAQLQSAIKSLGTAPARKAAGTGPSGKGKAGEEDLRKIMMTNKKAKLYNKMKYGNAERQAEKDTLETKRLAIEKRKRKEARAAGKA